MKPEDMENSIWKRLSPFTSYEVSSSGQVRRAYDIRGREKQHKRLLQPTIRKGYATVRLSQVGVGSKNVFVHHLVLNAFTGSRPDGMECRHLNGKKADNRLSNLKWGTHRENYQDNIRHGTARLKRGNAIKGSSRDPQTLKLSLGQCADIRRLYEPRRVSIANLANRYGVAAATIQKVLAGTYPKRAW